MYIDFSVNSNKGRVRQFNEDKATVIVNSLGYFMGALCDGMGGHFGGQMASNISVSLLKEEFLNMSENTVSSSDIIAWSQKAIQNIYKKINEFGLNNKNFLDMGTTLVAVIIAHNKVFVLNIGDSRAYFVTNYFAQQLTEDHTLLNYLKENKENTDEPLNIKESFVNGHALTSALGPQKDYKLDIFTFKVQDGFILLASDGFYNFTSDASVIATLMRPLSIEEKNDELITSVLGRSNDNITVVLIEIKKSNNLQSDSSEN